MIMRWYTICGNCGLKRQCIDGLYCDECTKSIQDSVQWVQKIRGDNNGDFGINSKD